MLEGNPGEVLISSASDHGHRGQRDRQGAACVTHAWVLPGVKPRSPSEAPLQGGATDEAASPDREHESALEGHLPVPVPRIVDFGETHGVDQLEPQTERI